ncbi:type VII secretion protein EccC [Streptomyces cinnamoneus]|uniref:Type VII secretion protein EccC n=1 Tax=Streptomyces cinnamoneus TaxID=53446 RepID=A0A2G1XCL4_STRCJ|nr:type VII secretion protein EccCa [Streptomyces cinnamoneus]PHQ48958.1 type VII secretion protein EccC [Streptomyces cinnamoneus]PPT15397.1 type VII secretion protein EccCa [Streptomyces cinnamoneus]
MSQIIVKRPPRVMPPEIPADELQLESPPELPRGQQEGMAMQLLPMLGMGSSVVFFFMPGTAPIMRIMGAMMLVSTVAMAVAQVIRYRKGSQGAAVESRRDYLKYLAQTRQKVRRTARAQRDAQFYLHPAPEQLWSLVAEGSRLWERRVSDKDFGQARVGLGPQQLWTPLVAPTTAPVDELEPLSASAMQRFLAVHGSLDGLPVAVSIRAFYHVVVSGEREAVRGTARSLVASLVTLHSPEDLVVAVVAGQGAAEEWDWCKWLPHTQVPGSTDGAGTKRLFSDDLTELEDLLGNRLLGRPRFSRDGQPLLDQPHVVVVLDGGTVPPDSLLASAEGLQGVTVVEVVPGELDESRGGLSVVVRPGQLRLESAAATYQGVPDSLSVPAAEALARQLAPMRMGGGGDDDEPLLANLDFTDLLGLGDAGSVDTSTAWRPRSMAERLRVPIGVGEDGSPVMLDLKEAAQEGMGPHGLCVGATGSGKSELLRTLVLGLAVTHSSETLNFVLADFKGGATFAGMAELPHVAAVITNLADDLTLVDRMRDSITGELQRRQELLRAAGNYANLTDYEKARAAGAPLEPLASLVLVIDEFSELLTAKPDFIEMFIQIGRIGRSLGVHLLLASQRLEEGRLRGLDTYLSYRIGLRTFSAAESRTALGVPDAYHLPSVPGSGYLKFGTDEMTRFKAAYVSAVYRGGVTTTTRTGSFPTDRRPVPFTAAPVPVRYAEPDPAVPLTAPGRDDDALADTVLDVIVRRLEGQGPAAHQVWLPPLDEAPSLDQLLSGLAVSPERGLHAPGSPRGGGLRVPLGLIDKPFEQRRDVLFRDFSGAAGHMLVVGGPRSGKSTLLRTLIGAFALTHTPHEVQFYGLDFGGGALSAVDGLPHVGGIASRLDPEKIRRTVAEVAGILNRREEFFRDNNIDSISTYRQLRAAGRLPGEPWGDVFLVIDGWFSFKTDYEMLEPVVADIAARGLGLGVHLVVTVSRYMEMRAALKDQLLSRLELRMGDPLDSELDRKVAANVPVGVPGRGLTAEKLHFLGGLPRVDGASGGGDDLSEATAAFVKASVENWPGPHAPQVRMLPRTLSVRELPDGHAEPQRGVAIGIDEMNLAPVFVDFDTDPLFAVYGESESGKTALLRLLIKQLTERYTPEEALFCVGDYRRSLLECVPEPYLAGYATTQNAFDPYLADMNALINSRAPGPDVTPQQLRNRNWWRGPRAFIIVDDYDLVATSSGNPLAQLVDNLPYARDTGVNFIIARSTAGAGRSMYEPFIQRFKELGAQGVVLSGDRGEGELLGNVKPRPLPPGRGIFVSRKQGSSLIQTGWLPTE